MIFIFEDEKIRSFWMKNTYVSLDIIYVDSKYKIVQIAKNTKPLNDKVYHSSKLPAKYAIEVNAGYSDANNIKIGDSIELR